MSILKIALLGHPVLQKTAQPVENPADPAIARLVDDMKETLADIGGTGLAAPQVHESLRLVVFRMPAERIPQGAPVEPMDYTVMCNPVVTPLAAEKTYAWERCLSIPGLHGRVPRWPHVKVNFQDLAGRGIELEARHVLASLLQHECDHLDGYVYPMRMDDLSYLAFNGAPGRLAQELKSGASLDPVFESLAKAWPDRERWI